MADQGQEQEQGTLPGSQELNDASSSDDELKSDEEEVASEEENGDTGDEMLMEPCTFESHVYEDQKTIEPVLSKVNSADQKTLIASLMSNQKDGLNAPRGIQSLYNSSSSDCTLYAMFAFNTTFDYLFESLFGLPCEFNSPLRVLMRQIVTPLRKIGFVGAKRIVALKLAIQRVGNLRTRVIVEVRKTGRFLDDLLKYGLRVEPQLTLHSKKPGEAQTITKVNSITVPVEFNDEDEFVTSAFLIEKWTLLEMKKLEAPAKNLIVNLKRKAGPFDEPAVVLPLLTISLADSLHNVKRVCAECTHNNEKLATVECRNCFGMDPKHMKLSECTYCDDCNQKIHALSDKKNHEAIPISQTSLPANQVTREGASVHDLAGNSYPYELYAVICENVTGYVVYACTDIDIESIKEVINDYVAPMENAPMPEQPSAESANDEGTTKPKNQAAANFGTDQTQDSSTPASSLGSNGGSDKKPLWVYYDPEAVVKEDVRGGFNVPQVYAVDDFQSLLNYNTLDKTHGLVDPMGTNVNNQHQYRILCESVALFYRPVSSAKRNR